MSVPSILFVTHVGDPGGAEFKMIAICRTLGDAAHVLTLQHGSLDRILKEQGIRHSVKPLGAAAGGVRREGGSLSLLRAVPGSLRMVRELARESRRHDLVVCFSQKAFVLASLAKPFARRPIVWFMNDILSAEHFDPLLIRGLIALSRRSADHVAVVSQESLRAWRQAGGRMDRVSVVYSGIDPEQIARQLSDPARVAAYRAQYAPHGEPLVGMFGRISRWKGQDVFLRALAQVPGAQGVIVGGALSVDADYERELRELALALGVDDRVEFVGHVDDPMTLMAACNVVAHCSTSPEPSGRVIAEAMFAGTPVIGSDAGGVPEFIVQNETGLLTPLKDDAALAAAIRRYLDDPEWSRGVAARARVRAEQNFSSAATISGFQRAIASL
ncbi:MAG TPA: glycosyltransferase family 4 protein [Steroidobacteraceae bacterium]|nr:glycosyltransferase family 4 protein [Steroidobacteraceae bacterium]